MENFHVTFLETRGGRAAANQRILHTPGAMYLQSYNTIVARYSDGKMVFSSRWDYSATTRRYVYQFCGLCGLDIWGIDDAREAIKSGKIEEVTAHSLTM